jgi:hypothetical protein
MGLGSPREFNPLPSRSDWSFYLAYFICESFFERHPPEIRAKSATRATREEEQRAKSCVAVQQASEESHEWMKMLRNDVVLEST